MLFPALRKLSEFIKLSHTVFALPFALASMAVAARDRHGWPGARKFTLILGCMFFARTCAMSFNRIADREFDGENPRTAARHLPTGQVSIVAAWALCLFGAAGLVASSWFINDICCALSPVALFIVCFYSLTKRFTDFSHVFLGVALALAPVGAWLAVNGSLHFFPDGANLEHSAILPLLLAGAVVFWLIGFDIIYALQDYEFDRQRGLHSLVVRWGVNNALTAAFLSHMIMCMILLAFGLLARFRLAYFIGMVFILLCLLLEHWLARRRSLNWINNAFFRLNALISVVFLVVTLTEIVFPWFPLKR
jgi:4-hydroxybenzoate polyprenyltransferase